MSEENFKKYIDDMNAALQNGDFKQFERGYFYVAVNDDKPYLCVIGQDEEMSVVVTINPEAVIYWLEEMKRFAKGDE